MGDKSISDAALIRYIRILQRVMMKVMSKATLRRIARPLSAVPAACSIRMRTINRKGQAILMILRILIFRMYCGRSPV